MRDVRFPSSLPPLWRWIVASSDQRRCSATRISRPNAVVLGEVLPAEERDLVLPFDFSRDALVYSPEQVNFGISRFLVIRKDVPNSSWNLVLNDLRCCFLSLAHEIESRVYKRSIEDPAEFWSEIAAKFYWKERWSPEVYSENIDIRKGNVNMEAGNGNKVALYWEGNEPGQDGQLTYSQLLDKVCQLANYLKLVGVRNGEAVIIYLPMLMELPIAMLACARIGAIHSVPFAGFSSEALSQRIVDCKPEVIISCNSVRRGAILIPLKEIVDKALIDS